MHFYISKNSLRLLIVTLLFASLTRYGFTLAANWTPPPTTPPANNVDAPLNTGTTNQVKNGGLSVNTLLSTGEIVSTMGGGQGQLRMVGGDISAFFRNDSANTYLLLTNHGDQYGGWNNLRPLQINNDSGMVTMNQGLTVPSGNVTVNNQINAGRYCDVNGQNCNAVGSSVGAAKFGGVYIDTAMGTVAPGQYSSGCPNRNPVTGGCSCPAGYQSFLLSTTEQQHYQAGGSGGNYINSTYTNTRLCLDPS